MNHVILTWKQGMTPIADLRTSLSSYTEESGFYALLAGTYHPRTKCYAKITLLYIGQVLAYTLTEHIPQPEEAYDRVYNFLETHQGSIPLVKFAIVKPGSVDRITPRLRDDIECCLTVSHRPLCNDRSKTPDVCQPIRVFNTGDFRPLKEVCLCEQGRRRTM